MFKKVLATAAAFALCASGAAFAFSASDVQSIQAFTNGTFYGTGVVRVEVVVKSDAVYNGAALASFDLADRGSYKPVYGHVQLDKLEKESGRKLVIYTKNDTYAIEPNDLVYAGGAGARSRQTFGVYPSNGSHFREDNGGKLHYTILDTDKFTDDGAGETFVPNVEGQKNSEGNPTAIGTWCRPHLELKLLVSENAKTDAAYEKYGDAAYIPYTKNGEPIKLGSLWLETEDEQIVKGSGTRPDTMTGTGGKFMELSDAGFKIPTTANNPAITDGTEDEFVRGFIYVPTNYNPAKGVVYTIQGNGISLWKIKDASNIRNGFMYDEATWSWRDQGAIVVNIQDRSAYGPGQYKKGYYDYVVDDVKVMRAVKDAYNITGPIVIQGNSRGTMASSTIIRALAGCEYTMTGFSEPRSLDKLVDFDYSDLVIDTFVCQNGSLGSGYTEDVWAAVAATGMRAWVIDGEQDTNNINAEVTYRAALKASNSKITDAWMNENVRLTGLSSNIFYYWGETDHSVTRIVGYYFGNTAYMGASDVANQDVLVGEGGKLTYRNGLVAGSKYKLQAHGGVNPKKGHEYTVYGEGVHGWALKAKRSGAAAAAGTFSADSISSIKAYTGGTFYGTGVTKVEVIVNDLASYNGATLASFDLVDRGSSKPVYGRVHLDRLERAGGRKLVLYTKNDTYAVDPNDLVYAGGAGARSRQTFGVYPSNGSYFREDNGGRLHYTLAETDTFTDDGAGETFVPNVEGQKNSEGKPTAIGTWCRPHLELRLLVSNNAASDPNYGKFGSDAYIPYTENGEPRKDPIRWRPTVDEQLLTGNGENPENTGGKFMTLTDAGFKIPTTANNPAITDGTEDEFVRGYIFVPENYNPANGVVYTIQGNGISLWKIKNASNIRNGFMYDEATWSWRNQGAIIVNIQDRSAYGPGQYKKGYYDYVVDDVRVMRAVKDAYKITGPIVIQGNSRGTNASSTIIRALAGCDYTMTGFEEPRNLKDIVDFDCSDLVIDTFICQNGTFGGANYDENVWMAVAKTGIRVWMIDGEQDTNNIGNEESYLAALEAGNDVSETWMEENVRLTGLSSNIFHYWGETDHSVTRIVGYYFGDTAYMGASDVAGSDVKVDENDPSKLIYSTNLKAGDKYKLQARHGGENPKKGHEYTVYGEGVHGWALKAKRSPSQGGDDPTGAPYERHSSGGCDAGLGGLAVLALAAFALRGKR